MFVLDVYKYVYFTFTIQLGKTSMDGMLAGPRGCGRVTVIASHVENVNLFILNTKVKLSIPRLILCLNTMILTLQTTADGGETLKNITYVKVHDNSSNGYIVQVVEDRQSSVYKCQLIGLYVIGRPYLSVHIIGAR